MLLALLLACNPWRDAARDEALWWGPTDRIEREQKLDLVELPAGAPIGYWPRVVIYADRVEVDDRAWFLSLPDAVFDDAELAERLYRPPSPVVPVVDGRVASEHLRGTLISALYERMLAIAEAHKDVAMRLADPALEFDGRVSIVADATTSLDLLNAVIFTVGQAQFGSAALVGASEGRLRMATAFDGSSCAISAVLRATPEGVYLDAGGVPLRGATCPADPTGALALLHQLTAACAPRFDRVAAVAAERSPDAPAIDPKEWRCVQVHMAIGGESPATVADLLVPMAALHPHHPDIHQGYVLGGVGEPASCDEHVRVPDLAPEQLDSVCNTLDAAEALEFAQAQVASGAASMRWVGRKRTLIHQRTLEASGPFDGLEGLDALWEATDR